MMLSDWPADWVCQGLDYPPLEAFIEGEAVVYKKSH